MCPGFFPATGLGITKAKPWHARCLLGLWAAWPFAQGLEKSCVLRAGDLLKPGRNHCCSSPFMSWVSLDIWAKALGHTCPIWRQPRLWTPSPRALTSGFKKLDKQCCCITEGFFSTSSWNPLVEILSGFNLGFFNTAFILIFPFFHLGFPLLRCVISTTLKQVTFATTFQQMVSLVLQNNTTGMVEVQSFRSFFIYSGGLWLPLSSALTVEGNNHIEFYLSSVIPENSDDWDISDSLMFWAMAHHKGPSPPFLMTLLFLCFYKVPGPLLLLWDSPC